MNGTREISPQREPAPSAWDVLCVRRLQAFDLLLIDPELITEDYADLAEELRIFVLSSDYPSGGASGESKEMLHQKWERAITCAKSSNRPTEI